MVIIRRSILYPVVAAAFGIIGAVIREIELLSVFDRVTGLAKPWEPITISLVILSFIAVAAFVWLSSGTKKLRAGEGYKGAMTNDSQTMFIVSTIAAFGLACGSVLYYLEYNNVLAILLAAAGFVATVSAVYLSRVTEKSSDGDGNAYLSALFVVFICFWMVLEYKSRSADPVLLDYVYDFLALCAAAMAFYYKAGFAFLRPKPMQTVMFMQIAAYFCIVAVPGANGPAQMVFYISLAILLLRDMTVLAGNLKEREQSV